MEALEAKLNQECDAEDLNDFLSRVTDISEKVRAIKEGELDEKEPDAGTSGGKEKKWYERREGETTEAYVDRVKRREATREDEKRAFEQKRQEALEKLEARKREAARKRKEEERRQWWEHARIMFCQSPTSCDKVEQKSEKERKRLEAAEKWRRSHDANDYSRWNEWLKDLDDPVAREQKEKIKKSREDMEMEEFEKRNAAWCNQMRADLDTRREKEEKKEERCQRLRLKGNAQFKRRRYDRAMLYYHESLKVCPFDVSVLTNIAQCHWKRSETDDAVEFASRAIFIDPSCAKALSRRAEAHRKRGLYDEAVADLARAVRVLPENESLRKRLIRAKHDLRRHKEEKSALGEDSERAAESESLSKLLERLETEKDNAKFESLVTLLRSTLNVDEDARIRLRGCGGLTTLERLAQREYNHEHASASSVFLRGTISLLRAVSRNAINRLDLHERGRVKSIVLDVLVRGRDAFDLDTFLAVLRFLQEVTTTHDSGDDGCRRWRRASLTKKGFFTAIDTALRSTNPHVLESAVALLRNVALCRHADTQRTWENVARRSTSTLIRTLANALSRTRKNVRLYADFRTEATGALANLALHEDLRSNFVCVDGKTTECAMTQLMYIVCSRLDADARVRRSNAIAALSNSSHDGQACRAIVEFQSNSGVSTLLRCFQDSLRSKRDEDAAHLVSIVVRSVQLSTSTSLDVVCETSSFDSLVRVFVDASLSLCRKLVSLLALCLKHRGASLVDRFHSLRGTSKLAMLIPDTEVELKRSDAVSYGNACQCVIACAEDCSSASAQSLFRHGIVPRLVVVLKATENKSAKKNAAIALAKFAKNATMLAEIRKHRGMEILLALGSSVLG